MKMITLLVSIWACVSAFGQETFPDGTPIPDWFRQNEVVKVENLGKQYRITDHGVVNDSTLLQTEKIQAVIDLAAKNGGGVVVVPQGTFLTASIFFKPGTHLHLEAEGVLKGSDDISNYPVVMTRIEGQTLKYFPALVNADGVDGFTISGKGTLNGNGLRFWKSFWQRRKVIPKCTNMDELRPRLLYVSNSKDVQISGVSLINSPFWTSHFYRCQNVKLLGLHIFAPKAPVKAPSSDAVDIDACTNFHIKGCYMSVNDDAVALKGGKGPWADKDENNGGNLNVIIEDCEYGFCHSALTAGSESIHNRNILFRRCTVNKAQRLLWLKMRPDTPQHYEYITVEDIKGSATNFLYIRPWTQFFDLKGRKDMPTSRCNNITMRNITFDCLTFFDVRPSEQFKLENFTFENLTVKAQKPEFHREYVDNFTVKNVQVNDQKY